MKNLPKSNQRTLILSYQTKCSGVFSFEYASEAPKCEYVHPLENVYQISQDNVTYRQILYHSGCTNWNWKEASCVSCKSQRPVALINPQNKSKWNSPIGLVHKSFICLGFLKVVRYF